MAFEIPEKAWSPLSKLSQYTETQLEALNNAVKRCPPSLNFGDFTSAIAKAAKIDLHEARDILGVLAGLYLARVGSENTVSEFVSQVVEEIQEKVSAPEKSEKPNWDSFKKHLSDILSQDKTLGVSCKAVSVLTDHQHAFRSARILSDIRPIFGSNPSEEPVAAVAVHMLKIVYAADPGNSSVEFFVALDSADLVKLEEVIKRAKEKDKSLKSTAERMKLQWLEAKA